VCVRGWATVMKLGVRDGKKEGVDRLGEWLDWVGGLLERGERLEPMVTGLPVEWSVGGDVLRVSDMDCREHGY